MKTRWIYRSICILMMVAGLFNLRSCIPYHKEIRREVVVVEKYRTDAGYKVSAKWLLIVKVVDNNPNHKKAVSVDVSPATYYECKKGSSYYMKLSESEINPTDERARTDVILLIVFLVGFFGIFFTWVDWDVF